MELLCGSKEELSHVEEPNRCEYHARMTTPAACSTEDSRALQKLIAELDAATNKDEL